MALMVMDPLSSWTLMSSVVDERFACDEHVVRRGEEARQLVLGEQHALREVLLVAQIGLRREPQGGAGGAALREDHALREQDALGEEDAAAAEDVAVPQHRTLG